MFLGSHDDNRTHTAHFVLKSMNEGLISRVEARSFLWCLYPEFQEVMKKATGDALLDLKTEIVSRKMDGRD